MLDLSDFFGIDVETRFDTWFHGEFAAEFQERWPDKGITLTILDPDDVLDRHLAWEDPRGFSIYTSFLGDEEGHKKPDGTLENVDGKLRYVLRTASDSVRAEEDYAYLRPGDFPWEGAGEHMGFVGGVSGLAKEDDWKVFCQCIDKLIELLGVIGKAAKEKAESLRKSDDPPTGAKYLNVTLTEDEVWPPETTEE